MISVVCIIPSTLNFSARRRIRLLCKRLQNSEFKQFKLYFEFVTSQAKNVQGFTQKVLHDAVSEGQYSVTVVSKSAGFSDSNNVIFEKYSNNLPDYFLLLNDDVWLKNNFFEAFVKLTNNEEVDVVAPLVVSIPDSIQKKKLVIDSFGVEYFRSGYAKNVISIKQKSELFSASCLFISGKSIEKIKEECGYIFNPLLFYYLEDVELAIRCRQIGLKIKKTEKLVAFHLGSSTSGKRSYFSMYQTYRNMIWLIFLLWPTSVILRNLPNILLVQAWVILYSIRSFGFLMYIKIILDTVKHMRLLLEYRKKHFKSQKKYKIESFFTNLSFRTYHGIKIKAV